MVQKKAGESRKPCDEAKAALETMPGGATVGNLMALDHRMRNKCFACFRGARATDEGLAAEYDSAADDAAKRGQHAHAHTTGYCPQPHGVIHGA